VRRINEKYPLVLLDMVRSIQDILYLVNQIKRNGRGRGWKGGGPRGRVWGQSLRLVLNKDVCATVDFTT